MELSQLRDFISVVEAKSFSGAAARTFISHSQLSRSVSALEDELGLKLINRNNRYQGLTPAGECLVREAYALLEMEASIKETMAEFHTGEDDV